MSTRSGGRAGTGRSAVWPRTGTGVHLQLGQEPSLTQATVVRVCEPDLVLSAAVRVLNGSLVPAPPPLGGSVVLFWEGPRGRHSLHGVLQQENAEGWWVRPAGDVETQQRRGAVREPVRLPLTLVVGGAAVSGDVVDLSETGLRALLAQQLPDGETAVAHFSVNGADLALRVTLIRCDPTESGTWTVAGQFEHSSREADVIRRFVFTRQRRALKGGF